MKSSIFNKNFIVIFIIFLIVYSAIAFVLTTPRPYEEYFQIYILGKKGLASDYYPLPNRTVPLDTNVTWYIVVENYVRKNTLVLIKFKFGNETLKGVNDTNFSPAEMPLIKETLRILMPEEKWIIKVTWKIKKIEKINGSYILTINFNGTNYTPNVTSKDYFRFVIELWTYDKEGFIIGWNSNEGRKIAWLQMWFKIHETS